MLVLYWALETKCKENLCAPKIELILSMAAAKKVLDPAANKQTS